MAFAGLRTGAPATRTVRREVGGAGRGSRASPQTSNRSQIEPMTALASASARGLA